MALIKTVPPEEAQGSVKEGYEMFMQHLGIIPSPMEMMSVSPALFELQLKKIHYFSSHPRLSFSLLTHIRYLVAHNLEFRFCMDFNRFLLKKQGLSDEDIERMEEDPSASLLEANENAMLNFVVHAAIAPGSVTERNFYELKELGWEDSDILDALSHGVNMIDHAIMMQVFQMGQDCMLD